MSLLREGLLELWCLPSWSPTASRFKSLARLSTHLLNEKRTKGSTAFSPAVSECKHALVRNISALYRNSLETTPWLTITDLIHSLQANKEDINQGYPQRKYL